MAGIDASALLRVAETRAGLTDWGWFDLETPLGVLVRALNEEAALTPAGQRAAAERLALVLEGRLRMIEDRKRRPEIAREVIRRPIFIPGLPRSGTTTLLQLLAQDPANRSPLTWEALSPSPPPQRATFSADPRIGRIQAMLEAHGFTRPEVMAMHPFGAEVAEECIFLCEHTMTYTPYGAFWHVPSYGAFIAGADHRAVFQVHREVLQHLQSANPAERWVLKAPTLIQTHRDLGRIIPSLAKLFGALRSLFTDDPAKADVAEAARSQLGAWRAGLDAVTAFRERPGMDARFVDVDYKGLLADPIGTARAIYARLDLPLPADAAGRMQDWLDANPQGKHGAHTYALAGCGLTEADIDGAFGDYMERYRVTREPRL
jgi:hypothetical protein